VKLDFPLQRPRCDLADPLACHLESKTEFKENFDKTWKLKANSEGMYEARYVSRSAYDRDAQFRGTNAQL
jgi:hypothetical protein